MEPVASWRLSTTGDPWSDIKYKRITGPDFSLSRTGMTAKERLMIHGAALHWFAAHCLRWEYYAVKPWGIIIGPHGRTLPDLYRQLVPMIVSSLEFTPIDDARPSDPLISDPSAPANTYGEYYFVDISYEPWHGGTHDDVITREVSFEEQLLPIGPAKATVHTGDITQQIDSSQATPNKDKSIPAYFHVPIVKITLTYKYVRGVNLFGTEGLHYYLGKVNQYDGNAWLFNYEPQTILLTGFSGKQEKGFLAPTEDTVEKWWTLTFHFSCRRILDEDGKVYGWNHTWSPNEKAWIYYLRKDSTKKMYEEADLNNLCWIKPD